MATAIAQVMNYHKYPEASHGTGHATVAGTDLTRDLNVTFDWGNMIDNYNNGYSATEADAVANLMVTCGFAVDMMYSTQGSGAYDMNVPKAFTQHFDYDLSAWLYYRNYYTLTEWEHMLVNELTENGPIYYSGQSPEGGHAFVCDGYEGDGLFHFNWGWGGAYDGFSESTRSTLKVRESAALKGLQLRADRHDGCKKTCRWLRTSGIKINNAGRSSASHDHGRISDD